MRTNFFRNFSIFIKTQKTPNPSFLKFLPGKEILKEGLTVDFSNINESLKSPLAKKLFDVNGINRVMYGHDFISVGKKDEVDWNEIKPIILDLMSDHFTKNLEVYNEEYQEPEDTRIKETDSEVLALIKEIIAVRIRPTINEDGGDIKLISFDEKSGVVKLCMKGSCSTCSSSSVTLKNGIEKMLLHYVAEVKAVEAVNEDEIQEVIDP